MKELPAQLWVQEAHLYTHTQLSKKAIQLRSQVETTYVVIALSKLVPWQSAQACIVL